MDKELTQEQTGKLNAEFRKAWPNLNDSDIALYKNSRNREKFISTVVKKQGIDNVAALKRLKEVEEKCGCGHSTKAA